MISKRQVCSQCVNRVDPAFSRQNGQYSESEKLRFGGAFLLVKLCYYLDMKITQNISSYAPIVLRFGLVFVFIWFGLSQLLHQAAWISYIPDYATRLSGLSPEKIVIANGIFEVVFAVLLAIGIKIRVVATLLALHLFTIVINLGINEIGVRDIGLTAACFSIALHGADRFSFDREIPA